MLNFIFKKGNKQDKSVPRNINTETAILTG